MTKRTVGGDGTFEFEVASTDADTSVDDPAFSLATAAGSASINTAVRGLRPNGPTQTDITVTELDPAPTGFELTDIACRDVLTGDPLGSIDLASGTATVTGVEAGDSVLCTYTNVRRPSVTVTKTTIDATGSFDFTATNLEAFPPVLTLDTTSVNPTTSESYTVATITEDVTITESLNGDWELTSLVCVDSGGSVVATTVDGTTTTIPSSALASGRDLNCVFENNAPVVDLEKSSGSVSGGSFAEGSYTVTYNVTATNTGSVDGTYGFVDSATAPAGMTVAGVAISSSDTDVTTTATNGIADASVAGEPIAPGDSEVWLVTVTYVIDDPTAVVAGSGTCDESSGVGGFANAIVGDDDSSNNNACVDVPAETMVQLTKVVTDVDGNAGVNFSAAGQIVHYELSVSNSGNTPIHDVTVSDPNATPGSVVLVGGDDGNGVLDPGETWVYFAEHTVIQADLDAGQIDNTASLAGAADTNGDGVGDLAVADSDSAVIFADQTPGVELLKLAQALTDTNGDGGIGVGDTLTYTFHVYNTGNTTLTNIAVGDPLVAVTGGPIASLAPGAADLTTFTATYVITQSDVDNGSVTNSAVVAGTDPSGTTVADQSDDPNDPTDIDPDGDGDPDDPTVVVLDQIADLDLLKTAGPLTDSNGDGLVGGVGDTIDYTFTVTNTGNVTLTDITITDPLVTVTGGPIAELAPGGSDSSTFTATYVITQTDIDAGAITNSALAEGTDPTGDPVTDTSDDPNDPTDIDPDGDGDPDDPTVVTLDQIADLDLLKTAGPLTDSNGDGVVGGVGDTIDYTFTVTNTGNTTLTDITITDPIVTVTGDPIAVLSPGVSDSTTFTATYAITQADVDAGSVTNSALAEGSDPNGDPVSDTSDDPNDPTDVDPDGDGNPDDPTVVTLDQIADLDLLKTAGPLVDSNGDGLVGGVGDTIDYTFTVTNTGNTTLTDITITDPLVTVTGDPIATLAPGGSDSTTFTATYVITQTEIDAGAITNSAVANAVDPNGEPVSDTSDDPTNPTDIDPDGDGNPDDPTVVTLDQIADLDLLKTAGPLVDSNGDGLAGGVGDTIDYTFTVTNTGNTTLTDITITDPLVTVNGDPIAVLAPGTSDSTTFIASYVITQTDVDAGAVTNSAVTDAVDPNGEPVTDTSDDPTNPTDIDPDGDGNPDDPTVVALDQIADLDLLKTAGPLTDSNGDGLAGGVGDTIDYTFTVTNTGNVTLTDITITDPLVTVTGDPIAILPPGDSDSTTFTATYAITQTDIDAGGVTNSAVANAVDPGGEPVTDTSDDPNDPTDVDPDGDGNPDDPTVVALDQIADLDLLKTAGPLVDSNGDGVVGGVGDTIDYTFTVTNIGVVTLFDVTVSDPLVAVNGGPIAVLAPGGSDSSTFTASYLITQADIDAGGVTNSALAEGTDPNGEPVTDTSDDPNDLTDIDPDGDGNPDDPTVVTLDQIADLDLLKTAGPLVDTNGDGLVGGVGDTIDYTFTVTNTGNTTLTDITITDPLVTVTGDPIAILPPGDSDSTTFTATYAITQTDIDAGGVTNSAVANAVDPGGEPVTDTSDDPNDPTDVDPDGDGNPDDPTVVALDQIADLDLLKTAGPLVDSNGDGVVGGVGDTIDYTFTVTNIGVVTLFDVTVSDPLVAVNGGPIAVLAPGGSDSSTFTASYLITQADIDAGGVTNSALAEGTDPNGEPVTDTSDDPNDLTDIDPDGDGNPDDPTVVTLDQIADLDLLKTAGPLTDSNGDGVVGGVGDTIDYTFTVTNTGVVTLFDVTVSDPLVTVNGGPIAVFAPGGSDSTTFTATYVITQTEIDAGSVTNSAAANAQDPNGEPVTDTSDDPNDPTDIDPDGDGNPDDPTVVTLDQIADLDLLKTAGPLVDSNGDGLAGGVGDTIDYTFTVTNTGNTTLTDITITDPLVTVTGDPIATLAPGGSDSTTFTATYVITQTDVDAGAITNSAVANAVDPNGEPVSDTSDDPNDPTDVDPDGDGNPDDPTVVTLDQIADLDLLKTAGPLVDSNGDGLVGGVGDTIDYTFTVTNTGNTTLTDITITDPLVTVNGDPIAVLAPGDSDSTTFTASYVITQTDVDAGGVTNSALTEGTDPNGEPVTDTSDDPNDPTDIDPDGDGNPDDPTVVTLDQIADLDLLKTAGPLVDTNGDGIVGGVGDTIDYTFTVTNTGNTTLTDITITDPLVTVTGDPIATLAPGDSDSTTFTATYVITQTDIDAGSTTNSAVADAVDPNGEPVTDTSDDPTNPTDIDPDGDGNPDDPTIVTLDQLPALALTKVGSPQTFAAVGDVVTYTYTVTNSGNVTMSAPFAVADDRIDPTDIDCSSAPIDLAPSDSFSCTGTYSVTAADIAAGSVTNTATASGVAAGGTTIESGPVDETVSADLVADLSIIKTVADGAVTHIPGTPITYDLTITNMGPSETTTTTVTDLLPPDTSFKSATVDIGDCEANSGTLTCELGALGIGQVVSISVVLDIDPGSTGVISNTATVESDLPDSNPIDNSSTVSTSPQPEADVVIDKIAPATYVPGNPIVYTLIATNNGPSTATAVVVTDTLPPNVGFDAIASDARCSESTGVVTCSPEELVPGQSVEYQISVTTTADMTGSLLNTAAVQSPTPDPDSGNNQDEESTDPDPKANLVLVKTGPTGPIAAGDQISYTVSVTNEGPSDALDVVVDDPLPPGLTYVDAVVGGGSGTETCDVSVRCDLGAISAGATEVITITVEVGSAVTGTVVNTATASTSTPGDDPTDSTDDHVVDVVEQTDLSITKIDSVDPVLAGQTLLYTLQVTNAGPSQATNVVVTDVLPPELTFVAAPGCDYDETSRVVSCSLPTVAVGVPVTLAVETTVNADTPDGSTVVNSAAVTAASDADDSDNETVENTDVVAQADLAVTKISSPNPFVPGQEVTYTISVANLGPSDAQNVIVTDTLPDGFFPTGFTPANSCVVDTSTMTCNFATLPAGAAEVVTITGQTDPSATVLSNTVTATSDTTDPDESNNNDSDTNVGEPNADLVVTKTDSIDPVAAGSALTYTITVVNNGPSDAQNVIVTDTVPADFTVTAVDRTECDTSVECVFPLIGAGATEQILITGIVDAAITDTGDPNTPELTNTVSVQSDTADGDPTNNTSSETTDVIELADVVVTKIGQGSDVTPGEQAVFTVEVANVGPSDADNVQLIDRLPDGLSFVDADGAPCASDPTDPSLIVCDLGTIDAGAPVVVITITVDVAPGVSGDVVNEAEAVSTTPDPVPDNNTDTSENPTSPDADLSITKIDLVDPVTAGTSLTYRLTVRNGGPSVAANVVINDTLPTDVTFVSAMFTTGTGDCAHDGSTVGGEVVCSVALMAPGEIVSVEVVVDVSADIVDGADIINSASVSSGSADPNPADNTATENTLVVAVADVGATKIASVASAVPGESISYTIRVRNNGPSQATDVVVTDDLPPGLTVTDITGATCTGTTTLTCALGSLAPDQEVVITITADIDSGVAQSLLNTVEATSGTTDPDLTNNTADTAVPVEPAADLVINKTGADTAVAGTSTDYTIVVTNLGPSDATDVVVTDVLPPGVTLNSISVGAGTGTCVDTTCTFPVVAAGTVATIMVTVDIDPYLTTGTTLTNTVTTTSSTPDPDPENNTDEHTTEIEQLADLARLQVGLTRSVRTGTADHLHHHRHQRRAVGRHEHRPERSGSVRPDCHQRQ